MDTQKLIDILAQLEKQIKGHRLLLPAKKDTFLRKIEESSNSYSGLEVPEAFDDLLESLEKRGNELLRELKKSKDQKDLTLKIARYIRYLKASLYDFQGNIQGVNHYTRAFILTAVLFMALTPQFYGFVLPIIFIVPIFAGLRGIKRRNQTGFLMTLAIVPMAIMTSVTWIRYFLQIALPKMEQEVAATAAAWHVSNSAAQMLIVIPSILGVILLALALLTAYLGYKYRDMFV